MLFRFCYHIKKKEKKEKEKEKEKLRYQKMN